MTIAQLQTPDIPLVVRLAETTARLRDSLLSAQLARVEELADACGELESTIAALQADTESVTPERAAAIIGLDDAAHAWFHAVRDRLFFGERAAGAVPEELARPAIAIHSGLAALHRRVAQETVWAALSCAGDDPGAFLAVRAALALGEAVKWHHFIHRQPEPSNWAELLAALDGLEPAGTAATDLTVYQEPAEVRASCTGACAQAFLLATLSGGSLSAAQLEIADRWIATHGRGCRIDAHYDAARHDFAIREGSSRGAEPLRYARDPSAPGRYLDASALVAELEASRAALRRGECDPAFPATEASARDHAAFLDVAERLWSPTWRSQSERAPRAEAAGETIEVIAGFDAVVDTVRASHRAPPAAFDAAAGGGKVQYLHSRGPAAGRTAAQWTVRDRSDTGVGICAPDDESRALAVGALVAFRDPGARAWRVGALVRKLAAGEDGSTILGVKRMSDQPIFVRLRDRRFESVEFSYGETMAVALFAPHDGRHSRIDSLIIDAQTHSRSTEFLVDAGDATFHIHVNRVLDRGDGWVRAGFEVVAKTVLRT